MYLNKLRNNNKKFLYLDSIAGVTLQMLVLASSFRAFEFLTNLQVLYIKFSVTNIGVYVIMF